VALERPEQVDAVDDGEREWVSPFKLVWMLEVKRRQIR
jgi:hypothetical protein